LPSTSRVVTVSVPSCRGSYCSRSAFTSTFRKCSTGGTTMRSVSVENVRSKIDDAVTKKFGT
jgi:hypothetical protein